MGWYPALLKHETARCLSKKKLGCFLFGSPLYQAGE